MLVKVVDDNVRKALGLYEVPGKVLPGVLVLEVAACAHLFD
jgi:hypothetical protein